MYIETLESRRLLSSSPFLGPPVPLPATIPAANFDNGGEGVAYHDSESANLGGAFRATGVDLQATTDTGGGYNVGWTHAGEWLNYTISVPASGNYDLGVRVADGAQGGTFHIEVDGSNLSGALTIPYTGGWQNYVTIGKSGIALPAGTHVLKLVFDANGAYGFAGNLHWISLTPTAAPVGAAKNLLFIGNSFTAYNNLPSLVSTLAVAEGHAQPNIFTEAIPSWTLTDHLKKLAADGAGNVIDHSLPAGATWDAAIIQDLSTRPSSVTSAPINGDPAGFRADAATLFKKIHANSANARDVLFETWARGAANPFYPGSYPNPGAMQTDVLAQYDGAAWDANHAYGPGIAKVAYVGEAWRRDQFAADLYSGPDQYHPSQKGSVLAALVLYRTIYQEPTAIIPLAKVATFLATEGLTSLAWQQLTAIADEVG